VIDGARRPAHTVPDAGALEGGAGGRGAGYETVSVADYDLAIGADVDGDANALLAVHARRQDHGHGVRSDPAGDVGQGAEPRAWGHAVHAELTQWGGYGAVDRGDVRRLGDVARIGPHEDVGHGRVADDVNAVDTLGGDARRLREPVNEIEDALSRRPGQGREALG